MKLPTLLLAAVLPASLMANPLAAHVPKTCKYAGFCSYDPSCRDYCKQSGERGYWIQSCGGGRKRCCCGTPW